MLLPTKTGSPSPRSLAARGAAVALLAGLSTGILAGSPRAQQLLVDDPRGGLPTASTMDFVLELESADLDGDGLPELVALKQFGRTSVQVYRNVGGRLAEVPTEVFAPSPQDTFVTQIELADFDGDGDVDIACGTIPGSGLDGRTRLLLNDGTGRFVDATAGRVPLDQDGTKVLRACDLDGDGDVDLLLGNDTYTLNSPRVINPGQSKVYLNDGTGKFTDASFTVWPGTYIQSMFDIASGDLDGDGDVDLLVARRADSVANPYDILYFEQRNGELVDATPAAFASARFRGEPSDLEVVDLDADGDLDLVARYPTPLGPNTATGAALYENDGRGVFTDRSARIAALVPYAEFESKVERVDVVDFDRDGLPDLLFTGAPYARLLRNTGGLTFAALPLDFVTEAWRVSPARSFFTPTRRERFDGHFRIQVAVLDLEADGDQDLVFASSTQFRVVRALGDGTFYDESAVPLRQPNRFGGVAAADLDGDGFPDLVQGGPTVGFHQVTWQRNLGDGRFVLQPESAIPAVTDSNGVSLRGGASSIEAGDVDGDGDIDLIARLAFVTTWRNGGVFPEPVQLFLNDGSGRFTWPRDTFVLQPDERPRIGAAHLIDHDGDGDLDVAFPCISAFGARGPVLLFENDGSGGFTDVTGTAIPVLPNQYARSLAPADYDGDGDVDLFVAVRNAQGSNQSLLFLNDGTGTFVEATSNLPWDPDPTESCVAGDLDGDGDVDLVVGHVLTAVPQIWRNDGGAVFSRQQSLDSASRTALRFALLDADDDGDLDLWVGAGQFVSVPLVPRDRTGSLWLNDGLGSFSLASRQLPGDGLAFWSDVVDIDMDGDDDLIVGNTDEVGSDRFRGRVLYNASLQLSAPPTLQLGRPSQVTVRSRADASSVLPCVVAVALDRGRVPLAGRGLLQLGPTSVTLAVLGLSAPVTTVPLPAIPSAPAGLDVWIQAAVVDLGRNQLRLSNTEHMEIDR